MLLKPTVKHHAAAARVKTGSFSLPNNINKVSFL